jgi:hypothetical protein
VVGLILGVLALGPALGRGFVLTYDMVFVPDPPISLADLGVTGSVARAVPSDLIVALASRGIPAQIFQKIILISIFVVACAGACALAERLPMAARLIAGVCFTWNPFVAERLIMGQWATLLGYAGLPWVVRELAGRDERDGTLRLGRLALTLVPAAVGGFAAMSITAVAALPVAWFGVGAQAGWAERARRTGVVLAALAVASLPWVIPSLIVPVHADPAAAAVFAARADTPFGALGSLLLLGGVWNAQAVPSGYGGAASVCWLIVVLAAVIGYVLVARPRRIAAGLGAAAVLGYCVAAIGTWSVSLAVLKGAISCWPRFALLRDGQQFIAPLVLAESIGLAAGVAAVIGAAQERAGAGRERVGRGRGGAGRERVGREPGGSGSGGSGSGGSRAGRELCSRSWRCSRRCCCFRGWPGARSGGFGRSSTPRTGWRRASCLMGAGSRDRCCCCRGRSTGGIRGITTSRCLTPGPGC